MGTAKYIKSEIDEIIDVKYDSGITVKPFYGPSDLDNIGFNYKKDLGDPGQYPFTRSLHPQGYRSRVWTTRQYTGFGTPEETNNRFKYMISHGQTGLNVAFDLPTQMGYDSDSPNAHGEIGRVGMAVDSLLDFEIAFKDIKLDSIGSGLTINAIASIILAMYQAVSEKYGYKKNKISATPQNDILKEMIGRGAWIFPVQAGVELVCDVIEYSAKSLPRCNPVSICGYHIRESGATPAQEIAYAFKIAEAYIDNLIDRNISPEVFVGKFSFNFNVYGNIWEQIAKFRAARKLWAILLKEKYGISDKKKLFLRGLFGGGGSGLTKEQPENNIIRGSYYALTAALSGAQTTALCSFDEAFTIPTERSALLSLRTLEILMDEVGMRDTVDPLAGSYFIETITKEMESKINYEMQNISEIGGIIKAIDTGYVQKKLAKQAYESEKNIQSGKKIKIGVNKHVDKNDHTDVSLHKYNQSWADTQISRLKRVKRERHNSSVIKSLKSLEQAVKSKTNTVMPSLVECCKNYATVGEMCDVLKQVLGVWNEPPIF